VQEPDSAGSPLTDYSIGEVAAMTGVPPSTLRGYEQAGLLLPRRTNGGHRSYSDSDVERIRRIAHLRQLDNLNPAAIRKLLGPQGGAERSAPSVDNADLGRRLRAVRQSKRLSLKEAAQRAGLSISFLSTVERGQSGISVGRLVQLATAYETSVARLTSRGETVRDLVRPGDRPRFSTDGGRVTLEDLVATSGSLTLQRVEMEPGGHSEQAYAHSGEEVLFILEGTLDFWIEENEHYRLAPGDALHLRSARLHRWSNLTGERVVALWAQAAIALPETLPKR
jgi:DNA-binding transcriptional MerR regulator/quercetin dioxygenase-like cupin family protein